MIPRRFRIKNYRSIIDSDVCFLSGDSITILAGMNESGKTSILEALEDFNVDKSIREEAINIHSKDPKPEIGITFSISKEELKEIFDKLEFEDEVDNDIELEVWKQYPDKYILSNESGNKIVGLIEKLLKGYEQEVKERINLLKKIDNQNIKNIKLPDIQFDDYEKLRKDFQEYSPSFSEQVKTFEADEQKEQAMDLLEGLIENLKFLERRLNYPERFLETLKEKLPNFVLFTSFDDIFPSEVPLEKAEENEFIQDLHIISDLDLETIKKGRITEKAEHKRKLNIKLKEEYQKYWEQDLTNLYIDWEGKSIHFLIDERGKYYEPKYRSKGKQWHLAFYIKVTARSKEGLPNIILIDEPGLFLHAKAQKDILKKLEDSSKNTPIIFSTHSPYLIDTGKLNRIRLVIKSEDKGTVVSNKIHKGADEDTLTPIITAIGSDLSLGLDIAKENNIILEGITDYHYLIALKEYLNFDFQRETHFIPGTGADKLNFLVPLMIGWGLNHCVILDNDNKGKSVAKELLKNFEHNNLKVIHISESENQEIEDLFSKEDFAKWILEKEVGELPNDKRNSQIIKQKENNYDKVLLSKLFLEKVRSTEVQLNNETKTNFQNLFEKVNQQLFGDV